MAILKMAQEMNDEGDDYQDEEIEEADFYEAADRDYELNRDNNAE